VIITTGTAYDYVDINYCTDHGITVCNTPDYTGSSVVEHAVALMLGVTRHLCALNKAARSGDTDTSQLIAYELEGKTAGIVGLGGIGRRLAKILLAFGMDVCFSNRSIREFDGARQVSLNTLLRAADVVFLCLPVTEQTYHLLGPSQFAEIKPSAVIVNISADELIDPDALRDALASGRLAGAGLDVIGSPGPYVGMANTLITPTHGWYTREAVHRRAETWVNALISATRGTPINRVA
jgi:glycerate dehydrogenase/D-3-phosphoglycerate dehydrogenase